MSTLVTANNCKWTKASTHIAFDHLGRPHKGVFGGATNDYRTVYDR